MLGKHFGAVTGYFYLSSPFFLPGATEKRPRKEDSKN